MSVTEAPKTSGMAQRARLAVAWTVGFNAFRDALQFGLMLVLVRILPPEVYGQFGFITAVMGFLTLYSFREFVGHTLQVREGELVPYQDHFTAGARIQVAVFVLANVLALGLRWLPTYAAVSPALHLMSVLILLDLPSELRIKMLERALDWRRLRVLHGLALVAGAALSVGLALSGAGLYALLIPLFLVPIPFAVDLFVNEGWRPTWELNWDRYRRAWRFGTARILSVTFVTAAVLLESSWLTRVLGFAAFGIFGRALSLATLLCGRIASLLAGSMYPVLTRIQPRTESYRRASALYLRSVVWSVVPAAIGGSLMTAPIVHGLYGERWVEVIPLLPWALFSAAVAAAVQTAHTLLLAHGRQDRCLIVDGARLVGTVLALAICVRYGMVPYLAGMAAIYTLQLCLTLYWLAQDEAIHPAGVVGALAPPLACAVLAGSAVLVIRGADLMSGSVMGALVDACVFGLVYLTLLRFFFRPLLAELVGYLPQRERLIRLFGLPQPA